MMDCLVLVLLLIFRVNQFHQQLHLRLLCLILDIVD
uniref:Uncharacterized protein n=1 Tax=Siphoviridae sp. ctLqe90 TaxID=2825456 RepID=A0A8S5Q225_9CAUD|nr:MAG TPA: hypothetical protein [Siphoviridae sp. ctLqe90]